MTEHSTLAQVSLVSIAVAFIALAGTAGFAGTAAANHGNTSVTFDNQTAAQADGTTTVTVANVTLKNDGYVTIHNESFNGTDYHAASDSIIGVSEHLAPGNHNNVTVTLYTDVPGRTYDRDRLTENATLVAAMYGETNTSSGNTTFNRITHQDRHEETGVRDGPYRLDEGDEAVVHDTAFVTVNGTADDGTTDGGDGSDDGGSDDGGAEDVNGTGTASVTYADQNATDAVTVESATLPDGGFVVIYNSSGAVLGTTDALDPGTHENLTVEVSPAFDRSGVSIAELHRDNDSDGAFNATTDAAYNTSDGNAVSSTAYISVESDGTATETAETTEPTDGTETTTVAVTETTQATTTGGGETTETTGPGFTLVGAVVALIGAALLARRR